MRPILLATVGVSILTPVTANAQDQSVPTESTEEQAGIADIVVTAERRASTVQRTPIAISAVGGEELQEKDIDDLTGLSTLTVMGTI